MADAAAPALPDIAYELADARDRVTLSIGKERLELGAAEIENLARFLGMMRAAMTPAAAPDLPAEGFLVVDAPRVLATPTADMHRAAVIARTPQFGWIAFHLDRAQAAGLGAHLSELSTRLSDTH